MENRPRFAVVTNTMVCTRQLTANKTNVAIGRLKELMIYGQLAYFTSGLCKVRVVQVRPQVRLENFLHFESAISVNLAT